MPVTIRDVARASGVSIGTVSSVINNKRRIGPDTREKVLKAIRTLGYDPDRNLPRRKNISTKTIGLVIPGQITEIHQAYYRAIMVAKQATADTGYRFQFWFENEMHRMAVDLVHLGRDQIGCDGLIIYCPQLDFNNYVRNLAAWDIPTVLVRGETDSDKVMRINYNERKALRSVLDHLYALGHRRFALYIPCHGDMPVKMDLYREFLDEKGIRFDQNLIIERDSLSFNDYDKRRPVLPWDITTEYYEKHTGLMKKIKCLLAGTVSPTAICCKTDYLAVEMIKSLQAIGCRVPEDVSVTGMNNNPAATLFEPQITTSNMPVEEMIRAAVDLLIEGPQDINGSQVMLEFDSTLVVRESTAPPANF